MADTYTADQVRQMFLDWRGVEDPCPVCDGSGVRVYPSSSTWQHGAGGQTLTTGVCDRCWGSGDARKPWLNLRSLQHG